MLDTRRRTSIVQRDDDFDLTMSQLLSRVDMMAFSENLPSTVVEEQKVRRNYRILVVSAS